MRHLLDIMRLPFNMMHHPFDNFRTQAQIQHFTFTFPHMRPRARHRFHSHLSTPPAFARPFDSMRHPVDIVRHPFDIMRHTLSDPPLVEVQENKTKKRDPRFAPSSHIVDPDVGVGSADDEYVPCSSQNGEMQSPVWMFFRLRNSEVE